MRTVAVGLGVLLWACRPASGPEVDPTRGSLNADAITPQMEWFLAQADGAPIPKDGVDVVLAPIAPAAWSSLAAAGTWSLMQRHGRLRPQGGGREWPSVPSVQAWLRDDPARRDWVAWLIQVHPGPEPTWELVVCWRQGAWRSGEGPAVDVTWPWPWPDRPPQTQLVVEGGEWLRRLNGHLWLESAAGRRRVKHREGELHLEELKPWSDWGLAPIERFDLSNHWPVAGVWSGDHRAEFRRAARPNGETWRWWLVRGGSGLALPNQTEAAGRTLAMLPTPTSWGGDRGWLLLREHGGSTLLQLYRAALRSWETPRRRPRPVRSIAVNRALPAPVGWPVAPHDLWVRAHLTAPWPLARLTANGDATEWSFTIPSLPHPDADRRLDAGDWARALRQRVADPEALRWYRWLVSPLQRIDIDARGDRLHLRSDHAIPDLAHRLAHPALWVDAPRVAARFASHRWTDEGLVSRRSQLPSIVPADDVGDVVLGFPEGDGTVCLVVSAGAPAAARRRLATILTSVSTVDLLALEDAAWQARFPGTRSPRPLTAAPGGGQPLTLDLSIDDALSGREEVARLLPRLQLLLDPYDVQLGTGVEAIAARVVRLSPRSQDPLLRALEIRSWGGQMELPPSLAEAVQWPLLDSRRLTAAQRVETQLMEDGFVIPLWTMPVIAGSSAQLQGMQSRPGLPPLLREARWREQPRGAL